MAVGGAAAAALRRAPGPAQGCSGVGTLAPGLSAPAPLTGVRGSLPPPAHGERVSRRGAGEPRGPADGAAAGARAAGLEQDKINNSRLLTRDYQHNPLNTL